MKESAIFAKFLNSKMNDPSGAKFAARASVARATSARARIKLKRDKMKMREDRGIRDRHKNEKTMSADARTYDCICSCKLTRSMFNVFVLLYKVVR